jgi:hypothetical protein
MRESAEQCRSPSVAQLRSAILRVVDQFRLEFTLAAEQRRFSNLMVDAATSGAELGSASASRRLTGSHSGETCR